MSPIQEIFNKYKSDLQQKLPKVDADFVHEILEMQEKLQNENVKEPFITMTIKYNSKTDIAKKIEELRTKHHLKTSTTKQPNQLLVANRMNLEDVTLISEDPDVEEIAGEATPQVRS